MIVIKSIETLPEHCYDCPCFNGASGYCKADPELRSSDWRPFWCPLAELTGTVVPLKPMLEGERTYDR